MDTWQQAKSKNRAMKCSLEKFMQLPEKKLITILKRILQHLTQATRYKRGLTCGMSYRQCPAKLDSLKLLSQSEQVRCHLNVLGVNISHLLLYWPRATPRPQDVELDFFVVSTQSGVMAPALAANPAQTQREKHWGRRYQDAAHRASRLRAQRRHGAKSLSARILQETANVMTKIPITTSPWHQSNQHLGHGGKSAPSSPQTFFAG